jgi:hypothetical protein
MSAVILSLSMITVTIVNSLYSLFEWGVDAVDEIATNNNSIDRQNLINTALELCNILKYEFILSPVSCMQC